MLAHMQYTRKPSAKIPAWEFSLQFEEMGDLVVTKHRKVHLKTDDTCAGGDAEGTKLSRKQDVAQTPLIDGSINGEECNARSSSAKPYADEDIREAHVDRGSHNADSLQEFLELANEYESVEALKRDSDNGCNLQTEVSYSLEGKIEQSAGLKEDVECASKREAALHSEIARPKNTSSQEGVSVATTTAPIGDQRNLQNFNIGQAHASGNRRTSRSASFSSITVGPSRSHFTIPQPFSLATDRRVQGGGRVRDNGSGQVWQNALRSNGTFDDPHSKAPQVSRKLGAISPVAKLKSSEIKNLDDPLKRSPFRANSEHPDEDAMSISSVQSCSQVPKAKTSRFTNTSGFNFPTDARAEKRKEYYSKLQERLKAKEEEMKQNQAKAMKEREDEIKLLRKSMTFRAHPVPTFYKEGPPPRAELAKAPTTRAKSPNFTRRDSHSSSGACTRLCNILRCEAEPRNSFSPQRQENYDLREVLDKEIQRRSSVGGRCMSESPIEQQEGGKMTSIGGSANALELLDDEISGTAGDFEDVHAKVRDALTVSPELVMNDEEEKALLALQNAERKHATSNGEEVEVYVDRNSSWAGASNVSGGGQEPKESNVYQGRDIVNAGVLSSNSNKKKVDRKMQQPFVYK